MHVFGFVSIKWSRWWAPVDQKRSSKKATLLFMLWIKKKEDMRGDHCLHRMTSQGADPNPVLRLKTVQGMLHGSRQWN